MAIASLQWVLTRVEQRLGDQRTDTSEVLAELRRDPLEIFRLADMEPDQWQANLIRCESKRLLLLCSRQAGKSTVAAALAVLTALLEAPALVLLVSRGLRQSGELYRKVLDMYRALGQPVAITQKSVESLELANGSRIVCLPGSEENVRSYSAVKLLVIDEA